MKAIVLLNGNPYTQKIVKDGRVYCCDGAYHWAKDKVEIDENLGDFDSLFEKPVPSPEKIYPAEKNYTDGEIAVRRAIEAGASEIDIYGGYGGRYDHFLGNLNLLHLCFQRGVKARLISEDTLIYAGTGRVEMNGVRGKTLSIFPFGGNAHIIESKGLKYPLEQLDLVYGSTRGVSNISTENEAHIFAEGCVLVVINSVL